MDSAKRVMSGTFGELWLNGYKVAEVKAFQLKLTGNYQDIDQCGVMMTDRKLMSTTLTGSVTTHKTNSRMAAEVGENMKVGKDNRFVLMGKLADPDAYGMERVSVSNMSFDEVTIQDWAANAINDVVSPFRATKYELLDRVG